MYTSCNEIAFSPVYGHMYKLFPNILIYSSEKWQFRTLGSILIPRCGRDQFLNQEAGFRDLALNNVTGNYAKENWCVQVTIETTESHKVATAQFDLLPLLNCLWPNNRSKFSFSSSPFNPVAILTMGSSSSNDLLIAVLGVTGAGKTKFISKATWRLDMVSHPACQLRSHSKSCRVLIFHYRYPEDLASSSQIRR